MIIYLTYNDQPSGVYWSQVTDVVEHLNTLGVDRVKLVALVSARGFFGTRRKIKAHSPSAWVIPMVPTMARWRKNTMILAWVCRLLRPKAIIARGVMAAWMALRMRERRLVKRVCFDGRGAYAAEWEEYRIIDDDGLIAQFRPIENEAVRDSDFRLAVSNALVAHWRERYSYASEQHIIVPCTLGNEFETPIPVTTDARREDRVRLVYSGSSAGWQSFDLLERLLVPLLASDPRIEILFLAPKDPRIEALARRFPGRVGNRWVSPNEVRAELSHHDHGILLREDTITNRVSSPTKFAEYLASGLSVIISEHIGDFGALTRKESLGIAVHDGVLLSRLERTSEHRRAVLSLYAQTHFTKKAHEAAYMRLIRALTD